MVRLEWSEALQRKTRRDDPAELGLSTWTLVRDAAKVGRTEEALDLMDYQLAVNQRIIDRLTVGRDLLLTRLARFDENEVEKFSRELYEPVVRGFVAAKLGVLELLQRYAENFRVFTENLVITEEPDRYVMRLDPCGSGGRLRRMQKIIGSTKKEYPWYWGKSGVAYYCTHCCVLKEVLPIEMRGYPICVTLYPEKAEDPCVHLYYKRPELIPDEYFTRIGKTPWGLR